MTGCLNKGMIAVFLPAGTMLTVTGQSILYKIKAVMLLGSFAFPKERRAGWLWSCPLTKSSGRTVGPDSRKAEIR
jgi:hypothetical protein